MTPDNADFALPSPPLAEERAGADDRLKARFLDSLGEAVIGTDPSGRVVYWNTAATRLYGWRAEEVIG